jgi:hypothetical protein
MDETKKKSRKKGWLITLLVLLVLGTGAGIYFYTNYLRKSTMDPMEMVPGDAALMVEINNYDSFLESAGHCRAFLNDVVSLGALDGMQFFLSQFDQQTLSGEPMALSVHPTDNGSALLLSLRAKTSEFDRLLKKLELNRNNFHAHSGYEIYEIGTHHRTFYFCYHDGLFTVAENEAVLKSALDCMSSRKTLCRAEAFQPLREMMDKNPKQNWLVVAQSAFWESQQGNLSPEASPVLEALRNVTDWSAYQITVNAGEIVLSGYSVLKEGAFLNRWNGQHPAAITTPEEILPASIDDYAEYNISDIDAFCRNAQLSDNVSTALKALKSTMFHTFTLSDTLTYRYFAVRVPTCDSAFLQSLLPDNHTIDSVKLGTHRFGRGNFAPALCPHATAVATNTFLISDDLNYLVFSDSITNLQKYRAALSKNKSLAENQIYVNLKNDGRWTSRAGYQLFFQNREDSIDKYLNSKLISRNTRLRDIRYILYNAQEPVGQLVPNNIYIRFSTK